MNIPYRKFEDYLPVDTSKMRPKGFNKKASLCHGGPSRKIWKDSGRYDSLQTLSKLSK